jgi:hypothetical protein
VCIKPNEINFTTKGIMMADAAMLGKVGTFQPNGAGEKKANSTAPTPADKLNQSTKYCCNNQFISDAFLNLGIGLTFGGAVLGVVTQSVVPMLLLTHPGLVIMVASRL